MCRTHHEEDRGHLKSLGVQTIIQPEFEGSADNRCEVIGRLRIDG